MALLVNVLIEKQLATLNFGIIEVRVIFVLLYPCRHAPLCQLLGLMVNRLSHSPTATVVSGVRGIR